MELLHHKNADCHSNIRASYSNRDIEDLFTSQTEDGESRKSIIIKTFFKYCVIQKLTLF